MVNHQLLLSCHPAPTAWANTGQRLSNHRASTATDENGHSMITDGVARADEPKATFAARADLPSE